VPRALPILLLLLLGGCSQPPDLPTLGRGTPTVTNRKILSATLDSKDYREIFNSINRDGKLDGLRGYFKDPTDKELTQVGHAFSHVLYENDDLLQILSARNRARAFSEPLGLLPYRKVLRDLLKAKELPGFAADTKDLWTEEWAILARAVHDEGAKYPDNAEPLSASLFVTDLKKFLASDQRPETEALWLDLRRDSFGNTLLESFATLRKEYQGITPFQGLGAGLASLLPQIEGGANTLQKLLELINGTNGPSNHLFSEISVKLNKEPELASQVAERFRPIITRALVGHSRKLLNEKAQSFYLMPKDGAPKPVTPYFVLFKKAIERVAGRQLDPAVELDAFVHNLKIYSTAYALTKWMEKVVATQSAQWATIPEAEFAEKFWNLKITMDLLPVEVRDAASLAEMKTLGTPVAKFVEELEKAKDIQLGNFSYEFPAVRDMEMATALELAVETVAAVRPPADPTSFVRSVIFPLTQPPSDKAFTFEDLETENLMVGINMQLARMFLPSWRKLKGAFFEDLEFAKLDDPSNDTRKLVLEFYPEVPVNPANPLDDPCSFIDDFSKDEPLRCRMTSILDRFPALYAFDEPTRGLPSPFTTYHSVLFHSSAQGLKSLTGFFALLGRAKFATPEYPFFMDLLRKEVPIGRGVTAFSILGEDRETFLRPLGQIDPKAFFAMIEPVAGDLEGLLAAFFEDKIWEQWPALTSDEREWLTEFFGKSDWKNLWNFFKKYGSRENFVQIVGELKKLTQNGYLKEAMKLLYHFQNPSLHRIADVWLEMEKSGQWSQLLTRLDEFLQ